MTTLFDAYFAVDWSARSKPSPQNPTRDSVWVGECVAEHVNDAVPQEKEYFRTREECVTYLHERLAHHVAAEMRVFVGFDFAFGYPTGLAAALKLDQNDPWLRIWAEITKLVDDHSDNRNNRFKVASDLNCRCGVMAPGPFWGCPDSDSTQHLIARSPRFPFPTDNMTSLARFRITEEQLPGVQPTWKLFYPGSVGGQTILGIPAVHRLRHDQELASVSQVWPFETGFGPVPAPTPGPYVLHAEIWPGVVTGPLESGLIRDQAQVRAMVTWLRNLDEKGTLGALFNAPARLTPLQLTLCTREEGWILGAR